MEKMRGMKRAQDLAHSNNQAQRIEELERENKILKISKKITKEHESTFVNLAYHERQKKRIEELEDALKKFMCECHRVGMMVDGVHCARCKALGLPRPW